MRNFVGFQSCLRRAFFFVSCTRPCSVECICGIFIFSVAGSSVATVHSNWIPEKTEMCAPARVARARFLFNNKFHSSFDLFVQYVPTTVRTLKSSRVEVYPPKARLPFHQTFFDKSHSQHTQQGTRCHAHSHREMMWPIKAIVVWSLPLLRRTSHEIPLKFGPLHRFITIMPEI